MNDRFWRPISIDCINPALFPNVALYLKGNDNYVLYKNEERPFTEDDRRRLERTLTEFLYVRTGDLEEINAYLENNLTEILARDDLDSMAKGRILYQTSVNYVIDVFESPEIAANLGRSRKLIQHMMRYLTTDAHALESLQSIVGHNFYIYTHSVQVTALNLLLHEKLFNVTPDEMIDVGVGSMLHDFGMIFITEKVLDKPDALSDVEYYKVKQHTQKGYEFLKQHGFTSEVALTIVRHHHERYDGNGYPNGIRGDDIPRSAQLSALCDVYSAMITERPYRKAVTHAKALEMMREDARSGAFNMELFSRFEQIITAQKAASAP
ncbi:MAG TPA: HD domain-containing phosphohydrolase [Desulfuromonadaceae bacterium]